MVLEAPSQDPGPAGFGFFGRTLSLDYRQAPSHCVFMWPLFYAHAISGVSLPILYKDVSPIRLGPHSYDLV